MSKKTRAARSDRHHDRANNVHSHKDKTIIAEYNRMSLIAGLLMAFTVGFCMIHWAAVVA